MIEQGHVIRYIPTLEVSRLFERFMGCLLTLLELIGGL